MIFADYMVLIAAFLPYGIVAVAKRTKKFDNATPRNLDVYQGANKRAYDAHLNAFEAFPFFAFSVLLAQYLQAPLNVLNILAGLFILMRVGHVWAYIQDKATIRSLFFSLGLLCVVCIFLLPVL